MWLRVVSLRTLDQIQLCLATKIWSFDQHEQKFLEPAAPGWSSGISALKYSSCVFKEWLKAKRETVMTMGLVRYASMVWKVGSKTYTEITVERQKKFSFPFISPYLLLIKQDIPSLQGYLSATAC